MAVRGHVAAAAAAAAFAAGFVTSRGCAPTADHDAASAPPPATTAIVRTDAAATPERRRPRRADPPSEMPRADTSDTPSHSTDGAASDDTDFPFADVEVVWPDGARAGNAVVYALPAGEKCPEDDTPPTVNADDGGHARLHVLAAGSYDVGALLGAFQTLATNVGFPRAEPLRLVLPEQCTVVVHMPDRGGPEKGHEFEANFSLRMTIDAETLRPYPGRDERTQGWTEGWIRTAGPDWLAIVPRGARCTIGHHETFEADPETFTAPAEVRIAPARRWPVHVRAEVRQGARTLDGPTRFGINFYRAKPNAPARRPRHLVQENVLLGDGAAVVVHEFDLPLDVGSGTLSWSGAGVVSGSVAFGDLSETSRTTIEARIDLDPHRVETDESDDSPAPRTFAFRVLPAGVAGAEDFECRLISPSAGFDLLAIPPAGTATTTTRSGVRWAAAWDRTLVSDMVELPAVPAGEIRLELAPGGFLVVVPTNLPPRQLGGATLSRTDGKPLIWDAGRDVDMECDLAAGLVLGPLPAGRISFDVKVGGHVLANAAAEVRAGTYETLRIPRLRAQ